MSISSASEERLKFKRWPKSVVFFSIVTAYIGYLNFELVSIGKQKLGTALVRCDFSDVRSSNQTIEKSNDKALEPSLFEPNHICSLFPSLPISSTRTWNQHLSGIYNASANHDLPDFESPANSLIRRYLLEETLTVYRLRRAVTHLPKFSHEIVKRVFNIIEKRIEDPENNPPLQVAVFGGSVTLGRGCHQQQKEQCAWPRRLEQLINQFAKKDIVKVYNLAIGGTASKVGTNMVKYWMFPEELKRLGPDVIINSYSTNDALPPSYLQEEDDHITPVRNRARNAIQGFIRAALQVKACGVPPLVVNVDDYLGPQQDQIIGEMAYNSMMTQLTKWYDTFGISYGDVVRDIVYRNRHDKIFYNENDVHYGAWAHQTIAWSVGFASLELVRVYCDEEHDLRLTSSREIIPEKDANAKQKTLPPPLTNDLTLKTYEEALSNGTNQSVDEMDCSSNHSVGETADLSPCLESWISAPGLYSPYDIDRFMRTHQTLNTGWKTENQRAEGWGNKVGLVANNLGEKFSLEFPKVEKTVRVVTIYFLRSYGPKWEGSIAKFSIAKKASENIDTKLLLEKNISGAWNIQNYTYSLTLSETMILPQPILSGETLILDVELVSGSHFKIMGMMLCRIVK